MTRDNVHYENGVEYRDGFLVDEKYIRIMEGKILTLVDLLGLEGNRAEVLKAEIRQRIWGGTFLKHAYSVHAEQMPIILREYIQINCECGHRGTCPNGK